MAKFLFAAGCSRRRDAALGAGGTYSCQELYLAQVLCS
jgi:hypothetical protein